MALSCPAGVLEAWGKQPRACSLLQHPERSACHMSAPMCSAWRAGEASPGSGWVNAADAGLRHAQRLSPRLLGVQSRECPRLVHAQPVEKSAGAASSAVESPGRAAGWKLTDLYRGEL